MQVGAAVNVGSMSSIADDNYLVVQRARGDAVVVDLPVWEGLVGRLTAATTRPSWPRC